METLKIFCCYAPADKSLMESFRAHLRVLELLNVNVWYTHDTVPGMEWERERDSHLHSAHIILLLISSDFISSSEHYHKEVLPAMERHNRGETRVIPIILRPVHWQEMSFGKLPALPDGGRAVTDGSWKTQDHAFINVVSGIKRALDREKTRLPVQQGSAPDRPLSSDNACAQLKQIIQGFKLLRGQIASTVFLKGPREFTIEGCESEYNRLYGDTMVFLATYLPECVSDDPNGFVETVYRQANEKLRQRGDLFVTITRFFISPLAKLEKVAEQIDACVATLELYKQKYFSASERSS